MQAAAACYAGSMDQGMLFDLPPPPLPVGLPAGLTYAANFIDAMQEQALLEVVRALPLEAARYKAYTARRRVVSYGGSFDYDANRLLPAAELIVPLHPLRDRVADWLGIDPAELVHTLSRNIRRARRWAGIATCPTSNRSRASRSAAKRSSGSAPTRRRSPAAAEA